MPSRPSAMFPDASILEAAAESTDPQERRKAIALGLYRGLMWVMGHDSIDPSKEDWGYHHNIALYYVATLLGTDMMVGGSGGMLYAQNIPDTPVSYFDASRRTRADQIIPFSLEIAGIVVRREPERGYATPGEPSSLHIHRVNQKGRNQTAEEFGYRELILVFPNEGDILGPLSTIEYRSSGS